MSESVDWSLRGEYMTNRHGVSVEVAADVIADPNRVIINPDYNSFTGQSVRIVGFCVRVGAVVTLIVLEMDGTVYGVNGWPSNEKDRRIYREAADDGQD